MEQTIEIPRFLHEIYDDMDEDILELIYEVILNKTIQAMQADGKLDTKYKSIKDIDSKEVSFRIQEQALLAAGAHTYYFKDAVESANIKLLNKINQRKSYLVGIDEYESILDYIHDRIPDLAENSSELSDLNFLIDHGLAIFEKFGVKMQWKAKKGGNKGKIRNSIPTMRKLLRDFEAASTQAEEKIKENEDEIKRITKRLDSGKLKRETDEWVEVHGKVDELEDEIRQLESIRVSQQNEATKSLEQGLIKVVEAIKDPGVKANGPQGVKAKLQGVVVDTPYSVDGLRAEGPDGQTYFLIRVPAQWGTMIEHGLRTMVNFKQQDPKHIFNEMKQSFFPRSDWGMILGIPLTESISFEQAVKILELQKSLENKDEN